jgi:hypothetical protein
MSHDPEVYNFLCNHLQTIMENDLEGYHSSTSEDLTLYEWFVTPHRIDGLPFHDFMMSDNESRGAVFGSEVVPDKLRDKPRTRLDLANLHIQRYGDTAIASYTLLISTGQSDGVHVVAHNESRVMVVLDGRWQVVHVHKSPAWDAPHIRPSD